MDDPISASRVGRSSPVSAEVGVFEAVGLDRERDLVPEPGRTLVRLLDVGGDALVVSQFTLLSDTRKGNRPSFTDASRPEKAESLVEAFADALRGSGIRVETGEFGAYMQVELVNDGPVTIVLDL